MAGSQQGRFSCCASGVKIRILFQLLGISFDICVCTYSITAVRDPALYMAAQNNHPRVVKELLEAGANINYGEATDNGTPLCVACQNGYTKVAKVLLEHGADVNLATSDKNTPLIIAAKQGQLKIVQKLLAIGADKSPKALRMAEEKGHTDIVNLLRVGSSKGNLNGNSNVA